MFISGKQSSSAENSSENYYSGQNSNQSTNESDSFVQMQLAFLGSKWESIKNRGKQPKNRSRRRWKTKKDESFNLLGACLRLHHHSSPSTTNNSDIRSSVSESDLNETAIKVNEQPRYESEIKQNLDLTSRTFNGQNVKLEPTVSCELFQMKSKR